jgi:putative transcriptional regulator
MTDVGSIATLSAQDDAEIGHRLSTVRLQAGLTQADVAKRIGVSRQHISNIEMGTTSPTLRVLGDCLRTYGTGLAEFFYGALPTNQTPTQREHHRKLQTLLDNTALAPVIEMVLDSFLTSMQFSQTLFKRSRGEPRDARTTSRKTAVVPPFENQVNGESAPTDAIPGKVRHHRSFRSDPDGIMNSGAD